MKASALLPFTPPVVEKPACVACKVFAPDCWVPMDGGGAKQMCWLCAHHVIEHEATVEEAPDRPKCGCKLADIFPAAVLDARLLFKPELTKPAKPAKAVRA